MIRRRTLLSAFSAVTIAPVSASGQSLTIRMATATDGSGFHAYATALIDALKAVDSMLEIKPQKTKGSSENVRLLQEGDVDMGLVSGEIVHERLAADPAAAPLKVVSVMYSTPGMFCVRADSRYRTIAELKGRPVVWGPRGAGSTVQARYVMGGMGLDMDRDFQPIYTEDHAEGPSMVLESRAAALWGGGLRWPGFVEIASRPLGARFIVPNAEEIERIRGKHSFLFQLTVPAGLYPGQYDPLITVGTWSFILARPDLDEAIGYRMANALHRLERTGGLARQLAQTTARNTLAAVGSIEELQPGVLRYYRSIKLVK